MTQPFAGAQPRPVLLVMSDLQFRSRIDEIARRLGVPLRAARSLEQLERHLANGLEPAMVLIDLECASCDAAVAIERLRRLPGGAELPIVAYAGHTNVGAIRGGRTAGAGVVLARSAFVAKLPELLAEAATGERTRCEGEHPQ